MGCRQLARSVSRGRCGHGQSSSRKVPAGSWSVWPRPEQQQEGAGRVLPRPNGPPAAQPDMLRWAHSPCPAQWPPRCLAQPFLGDWLAPATLDSPLILCDLRPCVCRPPLPRERPGLAQPRRPTSLHSKGVGLYSPRDADPRGCSVDPSRGRGSLRRRRWHQAMGWLQKPFSLQTGCPSCIFKASRATPRLLSDLCICHHLPSSLTLLSPPLQAPRDGTGPPWNPPTARSL